MTEAREATSLLAEASTQGLKVQSRDGDGLGQVKALMIDKRSGQAAYAILSLGGFLGLNKSFYPIPFGLLAYDPSEDFYVVTIDRSELEGGPSWASHSPDFNQAYADRVSNYYGTAPAAIS